MATIIRSRATQNWSTLALAFVASLGLFLLRLQGCESEILLWVELIAVAFIAASIHVLIGCRQESLPQILRFTDHSTTVQWITSGFVICVPWISNLAQRNLMAGRGEATELVWLAMLQNAAIWQAAIARTQKQEWTSFLLSCFLMLFGVATSDRSGMLFIVVTFGLLAAWWLMARYWQSIERGFVAVESVPLIRLRLVMVGLLCLFTTLVGGFAVLSGGSLTSLNGFMPTSGGNRDADPAARKGVGDGDMLIAAQDEAFTFGPVDSDLFLDSDAPSMYDIANDMYGEPRAKIRQLTRAISLNLDSKETEQEGSESKKAGKEFSALRQPINRTTASKPSDSKSNAAFHVIGKTPQHLRMEAFDTFNGSEWTQSEKLALTKPVPVLKMTEIAGKPWMLLHRFSSELTYPGQERLTVKLINIKSSRIASPAMLSKVHIDRVDREDFFEITGDGQLSMPGREFVPQLTVVHQLFYIPQLHPLRDASNPLSLLAMSVSSPTNTTNGGHVDGTLNEATQTHIDSKALSDLGVKMIRDVLSEDMNRLTDWQKVEAIVECLRTFKMDRLSVPNEATEDIVTFVLRNRRAPDYLLATTAAMLIRSQGISCRLVSGFYASPSRYDARAGLTEVMQDDLHTWVEVNAHGVWIPIEPCNTYSHPRYYRSWSQWALQSWWGLRTYAVQHPFRVASGAGLILFIILLRCRLLDACCSLVFEVSRLGPTRLRIKWSLNLLRVRMWIWRVRRPTNATVRNWLEAQLRCDSQLNEHDRLLYIHAVQRIAYTSRDKAQEWIKQNRNELGRISRVIVQRGIRELFKKGSAGSQWSSGMAMKVNQSA